MQHHTHTHTCVSVCCKGTGDAGGNSASSWHEETQACQSSSNLLPRWASCLRPQWTVERKTVAGGADGALRQRGVSECAICLLSQSHCPRTQKESPLTRCTPGSGSFVKHIVVPDVVVPLMQSESGNAVLIYYPIQFIHKPHLKQG